MIAIIDYGMGNIHSVAKAIESFGAKVMVTNSVKDIEKADKLVLPGVGAFDDAMSELKKQGLVPVIKSEIEKKKNFLGICLGLQLLFEKSQEAEIESGLCILKGEVKRFSQKDVKKVPHMGWNQLKKVTRSPGHPVTSGCPILKGVSDGEFVYFCHSYYVAPADPLVSAATTDYGLDFTSVVWKDNVFGVQFHPEKSQAVGLRILENFIKL